MKMFVVISIILFVQKVITQDSTNLIGCFKKVVYLLLLQEALFSLKCHAFVQSLIIWF